MAPHIVFSHSNLICKTQVARVADATIDYYENLVSLDKKDSMHPLENDVKVIRSYHEYGDVEK
jgi:hypothetical protein